MLKPDILFHESWDPKNAESLATTKPVTLRITILSARMLPKGKSGDVIDPFVEVEVFGVPIDCKQAKTTIIRIFSNFTLMKKRIMDLIQLGIKVSLL